MDIRLIPDCFQKGALEKIHLTGQQMEIQQKPQRSFDLEVSELVMIYSLGERCQIQRFMLGVSTMSCHVHIMIMNVHLAFLNKLDIIDRRMTESFTHT